MTHPKLKDSATDYTDDSTEKTHPGPTGEVGAAKSV
jgi:hypothetical protein